MTYHIAGLDIEVNSNDAYFTNICSEYITNSKNVDMNINIEVVDDIAVQGEIVLDRERIKVTNYDGYKMAYYLYNGEIYGAIAYKDEYRDTRLMLKREPHYEGMSVYDIGYLLLGMLFANRLTYKGGIQLHGSAIKYRGKAILFTAPSGVGKSTQASLWHEKFGDAVTFINDDKPSLVVNGNIVTCYGSPFAGKNHINNNDEAPLGAIVNVVRGKINSIEKLTARDSLVLLLEESTRSMLERDINLNTMRIIGQILDIVPVYRLTCTPELEAVDVTYEVLKEIL